MKTNAARNASRACEERRKRDQAADALAESVASIIQYGGSDKDAALAETFAQYRRFMAKSFAADAAGDEADLDDEETEVEDDDETGSNDHHASKVADLLVESGSHPDRAAALQHLLHTKDGRALLDRMKKGDNMKDSWQTIAKDHGVIAIAKMINADQDAHGLTEAELVDLIGKHDPKPGESTAQTFARNYQANIELRKAVQIAKATMPVVSLSPEQTSSPRAFHDAVSDTERSEAYQQLLEIGRDKWPTASEAQQFARAMTDPKNAELARKAHKRPAPTTSYEFPR
jgi:hypothetical protein